MIKRVRLQNYKNHRDTEVELRPLTVLVGPNGAGKTSFLTGLQMLRGVPSIKVDSYLPEHHSLDALIHRGSDAIRLSVQGVLVEEPWSVDLAVPLLDADGGPGWASGHVSFGDQPPTRFKRGGQTVSFPEKSRLGEQLKGIKLFSFDPRKVAEPAQLTETAPQVNADGSNTGPTLAALKLADLKAFQRVEEALRHVVPGVENLLVKLSAERTKGALSAGQIWSLDDESTWVAEA